MHEGSRNPKMFEKAARRLGMEEDLRETMKTASAAACYRTKYRGDAAVDALRM